MKPSQAVLVALLAAGVTPLAQGGQSSASASSAIVSPAVLATWISQSGTGNESTLDLLVLWRGTPGWFMTEGPTRESATGGEHGRITVSLSRGGVNLQLGFDASTRSATIGQKGVDLRDANVVLVDRVDGDPVIAGTERVAPHLSGSPPRIQQVLKRSQALIAFLRCDAVLGDDRVDDMMARLCADAGAGEQLSTGRSPD